MIKSQWYFGTKSYSLSDYERYLLLVDKSNTRLKPTLEAFNKFKEIKEALSLMYKSSVDTYIYKGREYVKIFQSNRAATLLNKLNSGLYDPGIKLVANQLMLDIIVPKTQIWSWK